MTLDGNFQLKRTPTKSEKRNLDYVRGGVFTPSPGEIAFWGDKSEVDLFDNTDISRDVNILSMSNTKRKACTYFIYQ